MKTIVKFKFINLNGQGFHLCIDAFINDAKVNLLVDTGASKTVLDKTRFEKIAGDSKIKKHKHEATGLGTNTMKTFEAVLRKISIGNITVKSYKAGLLDLSHVNESYAKLNKKAIDGVLGSDFMKKYNTVIDYKKRTIAFSKA